MACHRRSLFPSMKEIVARAPARIDFGGGWTDVPPYSEERGGFVCNAAVDLHATVILSPRRPDDDSTLSAAQAESALAAAALRRSGVKDARLSLHAAYPVGAGLGGSSAAGVAALGALAAWCSRPVDLAELAESSRALEVEDLGVPGGRQDHYAAAYGGVLALSFTSHTTVRQIPLSAARRRELEERCLIVYTGRSRISGETITAVMDAYRGGNRRVVEALDRMRALAEAMVRVLEGGDLDDLGRMVGEHWIYQRSLHPAITTARIDSIMDRATRAGALGAKALGASGGGCVLVMVRSEQRQAVADALAGLGELLDARLDTSGLTVRTTDAGTRSGNARRAG